jgi:raffinose/stachyose/melibiose transport system permease protein
MHRTETAAVPRVSTASSSRVGGKQILASALLLPAGAIYALFLLWPMVEVVRLSLFRWTGYGPATFAGLSNYAALWSDTPFHASVWHSIIWEVAAIAVPSVLGLAFASLLRHSRGHALLLSVIFFPALLPPVAVAATWVLMYSPATGLLDTVLRTAGLPAVDWIGNPSLALPALFVAWLWSTAGLSTLILWVALGRIGGEWTDIAAIEGATPLWRFRHIILPGIRRPAVLVMVINAALAFGVFDLVFITTGGGPGYATMMLPMEIYGRAFGGQAGSGAAVATIQIAGGLVLALAASVLFHRGESLDTGESPATRLRSGSTVISMLLGGIWLLPLLWLLPLALEPGQSLLINGISFHPARWNVSNAAAVWQQGMGGAMGESLTIAALVVSGTLLLSTPAAYALSRLSPRQAMLPAALLLTGLFQPTSALIIPLFSWLRDLGLLGSIWGIVLPEIGRTIPLAVLIVWGFLAQLPRDVFEAAEVDGAGPIRQLLSVAAPLIAPALAAVGIWSFVSSWNEYLLPLLVAQDGSIGTVPGLLATFVGRYDTEVGLLAAGTLLSMAPSLLIFLLLRQRAASGVTAAEQRLA